MRVFCWSYTMTYATPVMPATWSTWACTVEASRVRTRSTAVLARPLAMAEPLDVNTSVRLVRSDCTEIDHVSTASGTRMRNRKSVILARRPNRPDHRNLPSAELVRGEAGASTVASLVAGTAVTARPCSFLIRSHSVIAAIAGPPRYALTAAFQSWTGTQRPFSTRVK